MSRQAAKLAYPGRLPENRRRVLEIRMRVAIAQLNFTEGRVVGRRHKSLLPTYDVFDEDRHFESARDVAPLELHGVRVGVSTLTKPPSAELRLNQKDTDTLPPYEILDQIIDVERDLDIETICQLGLDPAIDAVRRINRSEYKRRQATPGLKISSKAFGVGRRYPMAADYQALIAGRTLAPEMSPP